MVAEKVERAGDRLQRIFFFGGNDPRHSSHRSQSLCFAESVLCFQLSGNVPVDFKDCVASRLEGLSACDSYFPAVSGQLCEVSIPFTRLCQTILNITKPFWEPGLQNLVD